MNESTLTLAVTKGWFTVPKYFARRGNKLVFTLGPGRCLLLFTVEQWKPVLDRLLTPLRPDAGTRSETAQALLRLLVGNACEARVSRRGRIEIPPWLKANAAISYRLLWVTGSRGVELWNPSRFTQVPRIDLFAACPCPGPAQLSPSSLSGPLPE